MCATSSLVYKLPCVLLCPTKMKIPWAALETTYWKWQNCYQLRFLNNWRVPCTPVMWARSKLVLCWAITCLGPFITAAYPILTNRGPKSSFFHTQAMPKCLSLVPKYSVYVQPQTQNRWRVGRGVRRKIIWWFWFGISSSDLFTFHRVTADTSPLMDWGFSPIVSPTSH